MADDPKPSRLGRGLSALLGEENSDHATPDQARPGRGVPVEFLRPNRFQPRHHFDDGRIAELAESIRANGIIQPILVRRDPEARDRYEIIAGERRWRAAQQARLHEVPVVVRDLDDAQMLEVALVENLQRQDLTPIDEALGYQRLLDEFGHTQDQLAKMLGKSRSHVANTIRLLGLPAAVQEMLNAGTLSAGHGRALLAAGDAGEITRLAREVAAKGLNVRQVEALLRPGPGGTDGAPRQARPGAGAAKDPDTLALEQDLSSLLGLKVMIRHQKGTGTVTIHYRTLDQLDGIIQRLSRPANER